VMVENGREALGNSGKNGNGWERRWAPGSADLTGTEPEMLPLPWQPNHRQGFRCGQLFEAP